MSQLVAAGRRVALMSYALWAMVSTSTVGHFCLRWAHHWQSNSQKIVALTSINTSMTFVSEIVSREILARSMESSREYHFITGDGPWWQNINRQSLINIWMTFFASLLGAPVYFFRRRRLRFGFFVLFGLFNSALSQGLLSTLKDGVVAISLRRLTFDFFYNGSLKFLMFEWFRTPITLKNNFFRLYWIRGKQDFLTALGKNFILNLLKFKG